MKNRLIILIFILYCPSFIISQNNTSETSQVARLAALGKLWGTIKYFHPYTAYKEINWDSALVQAIPKVYNAESRHEYASAVQSMLEALQDPLTKVELPKETHSNTSEVKPPSFTWAADSILIISITDYRALENFNLMRQKLGEISKEIF